MFVLFFVSDGAGAVPLAKSWHKKRWILAKIEYNEQGLNLRFVVTTFRGGKAKVLFDLYEDRGESENWIKRRP